MPEQTALISHPDYRKHVTGPGHPERPERLTAILRGIDASGLGPTLRWITPEPLTREQITDVHTVDYLDRLEALARAGGGLLEPDTVVSPASVEVAYLAAGGAAAAVSTVLDGQARTALALVRPPGHHATASEGMGFCLLNNAAIAATVAKTQYGRSRIFLIDWDVHHGNGTQAIFYTDPTVLYLSVHQEYWYPGTGAWHEVGAGAGEGFTVNIPLPAETGDEGYRLIFEEVVVPLGKCFAPDLTIISAGYDAHFEDPLGRMHLTAAGFRALTELATAASQSAEGRIVALLEGGYNLVHLPFAVVGTLEAFSGKKAIVGEEIGILSEAPYHMLRERARHARSIVRAHWNI